MKAVEDISPERLDAIKRELDNANVGIVPGNLSMRFAAPVELDEAECQMLHRSGPAIAELLSTTTSLYRISVTDRAWHWLRDLFEGELPELVKQVSRANVPFATLCQPNILRPDFINFEKLAEVSYQVNGLGVCHALENVVRGKSACEPSRLSEMLASGIRSYTNAAHPNVSFFSPPGTLATEAFANILRRHHRIRCELFAGQPLSEYDVVYWRSLKNVVFDNDQKTLMQLSRQFAPALTCLRSSKIYLLLPFHERTRGLYSDDVRKILPTAELLTEKRKTELLQMSIRQRAGFVIKYAGHDGNINWGARTVFKLGNSRSIDSQLLHRACASPIVSPWLLQERILGKFSATFRSRESGRLEIRSGLSARITPRFVQRPTGGLEIAGGDIMFSENWKCHGNERNWVTTITNLSKSSPRALAT